MISKLIACLLIAFHVVGKCGASEEKARAIVKGTLAKLGQFPYVVYIEHQHGLRKFQCTGSILTKQWVVTYADCFQVYAKENISLSEVITFVKAGTIDVSSHTTNTQVRQCKNHVLMEKNPNKSKDFRFNNNVAILEMSDPFKFNANVGPVTVAKGPLPKLSCTMVGFGLTEENGAPNPRLYYTRGQSGGDKDACIKRQADFAKDYGEEHLCVYPVDYQSTPCAGDGGGPLICEGMHAGLSVGTMKDDNVKEWCGGKNNLEIYMVLAPYEKWLRKHIPDLPRFQLVKDKKQGSLNLDQEDLNKKRASSRGGDFRFRMGHIRLAVIIQSILRWSI